MRLIISVYDVDFDILYIIQSMQFFEHDAAILALPLDYTQRTSCTAECAAGPAPEHGTF